MLYLKKYNMNNSSEREASKKMKLKKKNLQIAIDGPVGAGKSVGAYRLAKKLKILYVYTGAMYRAVAWISLKKR